MFYRLFWNNIFTANLANTGATLINYVGNDIAHCKGIDFEYNKIYQNFGCQSSSIISISCGALNTYTSCIYYFNQINQLELFNYLMEALLILTIRLRPYRIITLVKITQE